MPIASYDYNPSPATTGYQLSDEIAKCVNLAQETPEGGDTPYVTVPEECHQPEHVIGYLD